MKRARRHYNDAMEILDDLILKKQFTEFLTLPAYKKLVEKEQE